MGCVDEAPIAILKILPRDQRPGMRFGTVTVVFVARVPNLVKMSLLGLGAPQLAGNHGFHVQVKGHLLPN